MAVEETIVEDTTATLKQRLFTVDEYHRMGEVGILDEDDRVELINGVIVEMSPLGGPHIRCVAHINRLLSDFTTPTTILSIQSSIRLDNASEPEPDVVLLRYDRQTFGNDVPPAEDVLLLIEVSDSTLSVDRKVKVPMYAQSGIPETWIVDVVHKRIEVYSQPNEGRYDNVRVYERGETIESPTVTGFSATVNEIVD
jgi:Uma2 family endonuclease